MVGAPFTDFKIAPGFRHTMAKDNGGGYSNRAILNTYTFMKLPLGIGFENNLYLRQDFYNHDFEKAPNQYEDKEFAVDFESYIYKSFPLYEMNKVAFSLNFEGGYDPYTFRQYERYAMKDGVAKYTDKNSYSLYTLVDVSMAYKITDAVTLTTGIAAEYRNWDIQEESRAKNWRWQPQAFAMLETKF
ncbi:hypothetical protein [Cetobacterium sp. ZWU0022]|uniref:FomA family porin-like outer membrane protein n=1 Tax=Cetobacterium sp. ZWU0022 TaxID=1340502 RepID=UPI00068CB246|nr:hypothetical protein [Cetobacterium sp. ZWU0022]